MRLSLARLLIGAVLLGLVPIADEAATAGSQKGAPAQSSMRKSPVWINITTFALRREFGTLPYRIRQDVLGRLKLDQIARVSSVVIHGKKITGDLLVIKGRYQNMTGQATYWTEGYAFVFGTNLRHCTLNTCGPLPKGDWVEMTPGFGKPVIDYPPKRTVPKHSTVSFREAIPMPPGSRASEPNNRVIDSLRDIWLVPIYAAYNYNEPGSLYEGLPFPYSQVRRLSSYFGQTAIPRS